LPRQPVLVRYAYLVTGLTPWEFLSLLGTRQEGRYEYLTAYEFVQDAEPRQVRAAFYQTITDKRRGKEPDHEALTDWDQRSGIDKALIEQLPTSHFVWSDELAGAFSQFIRDYLDDETANREGMGLVWNPAVHGTEALLSECVDLSGLDHAAEAPVTTLTRRALRRQETEARRERWHKACEDLKKQHPEKSDSWIAGRIALMPIAERRDAETIRKNMKRK
jgi:hypothetical protein